MVGEPRKRVLFDRCGTLAQQLPFGDVANGAVTLVADQPQRLIMPLHPLVVGDE
jgi:hypothetical protein